MSRIGKLPVTIPAGVTVKVEAGNKVSVKGPKGELHRAIHPDLTITIDGSTLTVTRPSDESTHKSLHGLSRTLIANMVEGCAKGYVKTLEISGVGFKGAEAVRAAARAGLLASDPVQGAGGDQADGPAAHAGRHRGRGQGDRRTGGGGDPRPPSPRAVQGQGDQVRG